MTQRINLQNINDCQAVNRFSEKMKQDLISKAETAPIDWQGGHINDMNIAHLAMDAMFDGDFVQLGVYAMMLHERKANTDICKQATFKRA